ncbi:hypothetical protein ACHJH3_10960 [Campylobacter sp. MOP7]|uniref:hypothetical protein n=1 Tax=Campylobacter canis TaxID=3378588 RepID=UPI00387E5EC8
MFDLCLTSLISGVITVSGLGLGVDHNNKVVYDYGKHTQYVIADKYSLNQHCKERTRFAKDTDAFKLVSVLSTEENKNIDIKKNKEK